MIAFNHEQIKSATTGGYLLTNRKNFNNIANHLSQLNIDVLDNLAKRMSKGEKVIPQTDNEKSCFQILQDLECVSGRVNGSISSKKKMRNEIWSLTSYLGPPTWFITFSPADAKHPISLYLAGTEERFNPDIKINKNDALHLIAQNPVASARFFHFMVQIFLKHILGINDDNQGLYGETNAYYGTVEQQGRLTLHLHLLLWIKNALTIQEIRDKLMTENSPFQKALIEYLESVCSGDFLDTNSKELQNTLTEYRSQKLYRNPSNSLPVSCPIACHSRCQSCFNCKSNNLWWKSYKDVTNDLLHRENIHKHQKANKKTGQGGCLNDSGECKARMPQEIISKSTINHNIGTIELKKNEPWLNTFTPVITYLLRCNTDVTCLLSGDTVSAVISYVTDYVTKHSLKTYNILNAIHTILGKNTTYLGDSEKQKQCTKKIMTQVVNSLSAKLEIGAPMASQYLLNYPDHYTSHLFQPLYWKSYVNHILLELENEQMNDDDQYDDENIIVSKNRGDIIGLSKLDDYIYRPKKYSDICLYDWIRLFEKQKIRKQKIPKSKYLQIEGMGIMDPVTEDTFLESHPQHGTHCVVHYQKGKERVPDFIGGPLPCINKGNQEFYWATMLTLFKPWRQSTDIKNKTISWEKAFMEYNFIEFHLKIMKFFHIRYECNDAHEEISARKKIPLSDSHFQWKNYKDFTNEECDIKSTTSVDDVLDYVKNKDSFILEEGPLYKKRMKNMDSAEILAYKSGWLDDCIGEKPDIGSSEPIIPQNIQSSSTWRNIVMKEHKQQLDNRSKKMVNTYNHLSSENNIKNPLVKIVDYLFLKKLFSSELKKDTGLINKISAQFSLNDEQERAFRIITQHIISKTPVKLHMYLGGMGGTGKTQVIKALMQFFDQRNESHRFITVAPTGSAASIIGGSTYHSMFGIHEKSNTRKTLNDIRMRLEGVDYIFFDEVSMLFCQNMYKISSQLSKVRNIFDEPLGGINFIFAGDFAQLPPVGSTPLYGLVKTKTHTRISLEDQKKAIGKAIWHQVNTVVILRKNMRQQKQSIEDSKLRKCLENMRYKACTQDDINFLKTRIADSSDSNKSLASSNFRNVSIITGWNAQKDRLNELGCKRFAIDNDRQLTTFYSIDNWKNSTEFSERKNTNQLYHNYNNFPTSLRRILWNQPHNSSDNIPAKLELCIGMPIMIRYNEATECCITNGAEGTVAGWQSFKGPDNKDVLETLFVHLTNPSHSVSIPGLPKNVVPIIPKTQNVSCFLPSDDIITISRTQIPILPNFSMTDYASQGRTRLYNVVDLTRCRDHLSYYTCLSRGSSAEGTIILQPFDEKKITGGCSGFLRQEFRELEILDYITKLQYEGKLNDNIKGDDRNSLIESFFQFCKNDFIPFNIHPAINWKSGELLSNKDNNLLYSWQLMGKLNNKNTENKINSLDENIHQLKRKQNFHETDVINNKKLKLSLHENSNKKSINSDIIPIKFHSKQNVLTFLPLGFQWDNENWSCAYDSLFFILFNTFITSDIKWKMSLYNINNKTKFIVDLLNRFQSNEYTSEIIRNKIRNVLHNDNSVTFPNGRTGTAVVNIAIYIFDNLHPRSIHNQSIFPVVHEYIFSINSNSIGEYINNQFLNYISHHYHNFRFLNNFSFPPIIIVSLPDSYISIDKEFILNDTQIYKLIGIIYYGQYHFISRLILPNNITWIHDGMLNNGIPIHEIDTIYMSDYNLWTCGNKYASQAIYKLLL